MTKDTESQPASCPSRQQKSKEVETDDDAASSSQLMMSGNTKTKGNAVTKMVKGVANKASDVTKGMVKKVSVHSTESRPSADENEVKWKPAEEETTKDTESTDDKASKKSSMGSKMAAATKKTLSKPLSATRNVVKSTGNVAKDVNHNKKKQQKRDSNISELSVDEDKDYIVKDDSPVKSNTKEEDDSTVEASNSQHAKQTMGDDDKSTVIMIYVGPVLAFLLHDATLAIGSTLLIASYPTIANVDLIRKNQMPLSVVVSWILVAFAVGYEVALFRSMPTMTVVEEDIAYEDLTIPTEIDVPLTVTPPLKGYSVLKQMSVHFPNLKLRMPQRIKPRQVWSSLNTKRGEQSRWQRRACGKVSDPLMKRLLRNSMYQRNRVEIPVKETQPCPAETSQEMIKGTKMGAFEMPNAESLVEDVYEPHFTLRGMDVFMTEDLEGGAKDRISEHPFLIENGLRDVPSFVVNIMLQWANILFYFEMPSWVKGWDKIVEEEDDPDDVKALKKFLNGDDEYKDLRLKMLPYLVDGPMPIRILAPPKRELTIHCDMLPTKWHQLDCCTRPDGRYLHPCLELELDLMANKTMRGFASLFKRYLVKISVDVAVIIDKPDLQKEEEVSACVAMWRFDKVDVSQCPNLPDRLGLSDTIRASLLVQETELYLRSIRQEPERIPEPEAVAA